MRWQYRGIVAGFHGRDTLSDPVAKKLGLEAPSDAKCEAAKRWVSAVNNWGRMGRWAFHVCKNPDVLKTELEYLSTKLTN